MATRRNMPTRIYTMQVELEVMEPLIWRRLQVPLAITLHKLHRALQVVMGWTELLLHSFRIGDREYSNAGNRDELEMLDVKGRKRDALLGDTIREFAYQYDFGASRPHRIVVESIAESKLDWRYPLCEAGERAGPPEDVGGAGGYKTSSRPSPTPGTKRMRTCWSGSGVLSIGGALTLTALTANYAAYGFEVDRGLQNGGALCTR